MISPEESERFELNDPQENYGSVEPWDVEDSDNIIAKKYSKLDTMDAFLNNEQPVDDNGIFFRDGLRKIDFILVHEEGGTSGLIPRRRGEKWRRKFLCNLRKMGLDMEEELVERDGCAVHFMKLSAPWPVLVHYAEQLNMRAALQAYPSTAVDWSESVLRRLKLPNLMRQDVPRKPMHYFTCPFKKSKLDRFLGSDNPSTYFSNTQRTRIVHEILEAAAYGKRKHGEVGVGRLVEDHVYTATFPLHEGPYAIDSNYSQRYCLNRRQVLMKFWARCGAWYKYQPLDHVREYFGERVAYYFAWLGFYTGWLLPVSLVGVAVFLYGLLSMNDNPVAEQVCSSGEELKMCPLCDEDSGCSYWFLSDVCIFSRLVYLFDHVGTVVYSVFVAFWAVLFLKYWKRKSITLAHSWDCLDFSEDEERPRPQFSARAPVLSMNPVTATREPSFPKGSRRLRVAAGVAVLLSMVSLVMVFVVGMVVYRTVISVPLFQNRTTRPHAPTIASLSGAAIHLLIITVLGKVYIKLAMILTEWEMHRTRVEFDNSFALRVFTFQFINYFSPIFYIAFFKGRFCGYPGHYTHILGMRPESCGAGGCLMELAQELCVIMLGTQMINKTLDVILPKLKSLCRAKRCAGDCRSRWECDYMLQPHKGLFSEYLTMILQYGFTTIFVAAFPLAPLLALLNNWMEMRMSARKLVCDTRRVIAEQAQNIGIWFPIFHTLTHIAVVSNACLIAFTSEFLPRMLYRWQHGTMNGYVNFTLAYSPLNSTNEECRYPGFRDRNGELTVFYWNLMAIRLAFIVIFTFTVFYISWLIDLIVKDVPGELDAKIRRERYLAKQALADSDNLVIEAINEEA